MARRPLRDVDATERAHLFKALAWSAYPGIFVGAAVGIGTDVGVLGAIGVGLAVTLGGAAAATLASGTAGTVTRHLVDPSTGVRPKGLSRAEALQARGEHDLAAVELEAAVEANPEDPEAYLMLARLHRDGRRDLEAAAVWFRRARERARLHEGMERLVYRELVEVLRALDEPRAAPELARMAERFEGTPDGAWARQELAEIKRRMLNPPDDASAS